MSPEIESDILRRDAASLSPFPDGYSETASLPHRPQDTRSRYRRRLGRWKIGVSRAAEHALLRLLVLIGTAALSYVLVNRYQPILQTFLFRDGAAAPAAPLPFYWLIFVALGQVLSSRVCGLFQPLRKITIRRLLGRVALISTLGLLAVLAARFLEGVSSYTRPVALVYIGTDYVILCMLFIMIQRLERRRPERVLLLGPWKETDNFLKALQTLPSGRRTIFPTGPDFLTARAESGEEARALFRNHHVDRVYLVRNSYSEDQVLRLLEAKPPDVSLYVVPSTWDSMISRLALGPMLGDLRLFEIRSPLTEPVESFLKRGIDLLLTLALLVVSTPLLAMIALLIRMTCRGPVLFRQERIGRNGTTFRIIKFRTMTPGSEDSRQRRLALEDDPRVTPLGRWLRAYRLDELPQLWNVLKGEMSLVGPRPERPCFVEEFRAQLPGYELRHSVRPGITGIAQVYGKYRSHPREKLRFDLAYVFNHTPGLDLVILLKTAWVVLSGRPR